MDEINIDDICIIINHRSFGGTSVIVLETDIELINEKFIINANAFETFHLVKSNIEHNFIRTEYKPSIGFDLPVFGKSNTFAIPESKLLKIGGMLYSKKI